MIETLSFDDVLLLPKFSEVKSRKDVSTRSEVFELNLPIISSNMDTVTDYKMAGAIANVGGVGCLHRFCSIEENKSQVYKSPYGIWVSVGLGKIELERAEALWQAGAKTFVLDVAHGASMEVVNQYKELHKLLQFPDIIVGNFATHETIDDFLEYCGNIKPLAFKVGIGGGSACLTRTITGCGMPTFSSIRDCIKSSYPIIADGGIRNSGDFAKALAAGASAVMLGRILAGCEESPGEVVFEQHGEYLGNPWKKYRGSASLESYQVQNKVAEHRTPEGDSYLIPYTGTVAETLQPFEAGLRSAMAYVGANNLDEFYYKTEFIKITNNGLKEGTAHGKSNS